MLAAEETASSADAQIVDTVIEESLADLDEIVNFNSASIPDWAIQGMIDFVSGRASPYFGLPRGDDNLARGALASAKARVFGTGATLDVEYF